MVIEDFQLAGLVAWRIKRDDIDYSKPESFVGSKAVRSVKKKLDAQVEPPPSQELIKWVAARILP